MIMSVIYACVYNIYKKKSESYVGISALNWYKEK